MNCRSRGWFLGDLELNIRSKGNTGYHNPTSEMHPTLLARYDDILREGVSRRHDHPVIEKSLID